MTEGLDQDQAPISPPRVLIVMNRALANLVGQTLSHGGYEVRTVTDLESCRELLASWGPHLACIDIDLHEDCLPPFAEGSASAAPLIVFSRTGDMKRRLDAFARGADDLVLIPFVLGEIPARSYALMRRVHKLTMPLARNIRFQSLEVDLIGGNARVNDGEDLALPPIQQMLLYLLAANAGAVLSGPELLSTIWDASANIESNVIARHIRDLRVKLGDASPYARYIETIPGEGYRFKLKP